jgi:hypothetical protein
MLDCHAGTILIERVLAAQFFAFHGEAVGQLGTIVGQYLVDSDRRGQLEPTQEIDAAVIRHVAVDSWKATNELAEHCPGWKQRPATTRNMIARN